MTLLFAQRDIATTGLAQPLIDRYGRKIDYLRISVTDRCDFRCVYCMSEHMEFLPKSEVLSFEEVVQIASAFIARGTRKIRLTGGEPLVRRDIIQLVERLGSLIGHGLEELTLTTNGSQLRRYADRLAGAGVKRINVSLDTLNDVRFREITRRGRIADVLDGIDAAAEAGLKIKLNMVAMRGVNDDEIEPMMAFAHGRGFGLTLIEGMPLGEVGLDRVESYLPLREMRERLAAKYTLEPTEHRTGGPARYDWVKETNGLLGFITPMSHNFCESCNRVRLTCTGTLYMCLGQDDSADLRSPLRASTSDAPLHAAIEAAMRHKPKGHDFVIDRRTATPALARPMSMTGG